MDIVQDVKNVLADRTSQHGTPEDSFSTIAVLWEEYLDNNYNGYLDARDVAIMLSLFKSARLIHNKDNRDNLIDLIGYTILADEIAQNDNRDVGYL